LQVLTSNIHLARDVLLGPWLVIWWETDISQFSWFWLYIEVNFGLWWFGHVILIVLGSWFGGQHNRTQQMSWTFMCYIFFFNPNVVHSSMGTKSLGKVHTPPKSIRPLYIASPIPNTHKARQISNFTTWSINCAYLHQTTKTSIQTTRGTYEYG
jgi:hypothetical protein